MQVLPVAALYSVCACTDNMLCCVSGLPPRHVHQVLIAEAERRGLGEESSFDYNWVYRRYFLICSEASFLDLSGVVTALQERLNTSGLRFEVHLDKLGYAECVFFELTGGMEEWSRSPDTNVMLFDPTHGTNRYGLKLCCFVAVSHTGRSTILACLWIRAEDSWSFEWGFRCFSKTFRTPPKVIFTDHDQTIENVLIKLAKDDEIWQSMVHLLCVFHISKNLFTHMNRLFGANKKGWQEVMDMFWKIAKTCDIMLTLSAWKDECLELNNLIIKHATAGHPDLAKEVNWLNDLLDNHAEKWALRFVWQHVTFGIHSTQRAESTQAKVKARLRSNSTGTQLLQHLETINKHEKSFNELSQKREELRQQKTVEKPHSPMIAKLLPHLTPYGVRLLLGQAEQAVAYKSKPYDRDAFLGYEEDDGDEFVLEGEHDDLQKQIKRAGTELFSVTRETPQKAEVLEYDDFGQIKSFVSDSDFGCGTVEHKPRSRLTSFVACSCMFPITFGGIPCRHMIHVCVVNQTDYKLANIDVKWLKADNQVDLARLRALYSTPAPVVETSSSTRQASAGALGLTERRALLTREFNAVVDVACRADQDTFAAALSALTQAFLHMTTAKPQHATRSAASSTTAPPVRAKETFEDYRDLQATLGMEYWLAGVPNVVDVFGPNSAVLGKRVAVKWDKEGKPGWFVGTVVKAVNPAVDEFDTDSSCLCEPGKETHCNVQVKYDPVDGDTLDAIQNHVFGIHNMVDCGAQAPKFSWGIVEYRGLSNFDGQFVRNPPGPGGRGPKQTKRRCAHAGPTSRPSKRGARGAKKATGAAAASGPPPSKRKR